MHNENDCRADAGCQYIDLIASDGTVFIINFDRDFSVDDPTNTI